MSLVHVRRARIPEAFLLTTLYRSRRTARCFCCCWHGWLVRSAPFRFHFLHKSEPCCPSPRRARRVYTPPPCRHCCPRGCRIGIAHAIGRAKNDSLVLTSCVRAPDEPPTECHPRRTAC